jgi:Mrp family chromosome partitioning ATPase
MSRNFELLQRMDQPTGALSDLFVPAAAREHEEAVSRNSDGHAPEIVRLVHSLFLSGGTGAPHRVLFCGFDAGDASGRVCVDVAEALARELAASVCIVDVKLAAPSLHHYFTLDEIARTHGNGAGEFRARQLSNNLWFVAPEELQMNGDSAAGAEPVRSRLREIGKQFEYVLIAAEPIGQGTNVAVLGSVTDGVVLVLEANKTRRAAALSAKEALEAAGVRLLGTVLNNRTFPIPEKLYRRL